MKVLFLTPRFPYPLDVGTNLRNFRLIQSAAQEHQVHLLSFLDRPIRPDHLEPVQALCGRVELLPAPGRGLTGRLATTLASPLPDMAHRRWSPRFLRKLRSLLQEQYDLVDVEGIEMARYLPFCHGARRVLGDHNAEYVLQRRAYEVDRAHPRRWPRAVYSLIQTRKLRAFERAACRLADAVVVVSAQDEIALRSLERGGRYRIVPNAVDTKAFESLGAAPSQDGLDGRPNLLFTGTLDFRPNNDAVEWFLDEIFPRVLARHARTRLFVVGHGPRASLVARGQSDVRVAVTGAVDNLEPYWRRAHVYVLPMRGGGGVRFKALEAMAAGLPIVSTTLGMEGIAAAPGEHYLAADTPATFAHEIARLLDEPDLRRRLAEAARRLVRERYDWRVVAPALLAVYRELA